MFLQNEICFVALTSAIRSLDVKETIHDGECRAASAAKNVAYKRTLLYAAMRAIVKDYRQKRRKERRLIICKKRKQERREREEIEIYRSKMLRNFSKTSSV